MHRSYTNSCGHRDEAHDYVGAHVQYTGNVEQGQEPRCSEAALFDAENVCVVADPDQNYDGGQDTQRFQEYCHYQVGWGDGDASGI